jgi:hypothetical protein
MKMNGSKTDWPPLALILLVVVSIAWGGWKIGLAVFAVGAVGLGWKRRHGGPCPARGDTSHHAELLNIAAQTSGSEAAEKAVAESLDSLFPKVAETKSMPEEDRVESLRKLLLEATNRRHAAMAGGASSYRDPRWAAAAACESWLMDELTNREDAEDSTNTVRSLIARSVSSRETAASGIHGQGLTNKESENLFYLPKDGLTEARWSASELCDGISGLQGLDETSDEWVVDLLVDTVTWPLSGDEFVEQLEQGGGVLDLTATGRANQRYEVGEAPNVEAFAVRTENSCLCVLEIVRGASDEVVVCGAEFRYLPEQASGGIASVGRAIQSAIGRTTLSVSDWADPVVLFHGGGVEGHWRSDIGECNSTVRFANRKEDDGDEEAERVDRFIMKAREAAIVEGRTSGNGRCPVCEGTVSWGFAYNGHFHATCDTSGCFSYME